MIKTLFYLPLFCLLLYAALLFHPVLTQNKLPIPADTIVGLYHPWRDFFAKQYPSGIPYKNFLITDPVRQQYPWRSLVIDAIKQKVMPMWNPYSFAGMPLLANLQSAVFYPTNILFSLPTDFSSVWTFQVILQTLLAGIFLWAYLHHLGLRPIAQAVGILAWVGSGFFVSWLEWNTVLHVALWLPLILLATDKIFAGTKKLLWVTILVASLTSSFFAGHLQIFFYVISASLGYLLYRLIFSRKYSRLFIFLISYPLVLILVLPQLFPTLQLIDLSARNVDQAIWQKADWFLPWQNLSQLLAPDFFGNPATLNYFGVWNYQEFISYVGLFPLILALSAFSIRKNTTTPFFILVLLASLIFALPTPIAKLPFVLQIPLLSTAQPSRLIVLIDFSLAILSAFGMEQFLASRKIPSAISIVGVGLLILTGVVIFFGLSVSLRNLILPWALFLGILTVLKLPKNIAVLALLVIVLFDLSRFAIKFESFSPRQWLFPDTAVTKYLKGKSKTEIFRIATLDDKILPPNFPLVYGIQTVSGYDPLYLERYGQYVTAMESNQSELPTTLPFNRILIPKNYHSRLFDLLNVKYVLSLEEIKSPKMFLIFQEGQTRVYENKSVLPRAFLTSQVVAVSSFDQAIKQLVSNQNNIDKQAVVEGVGQNFSWENGAKQVVITNYSANEITINTKSNTDSFLVLTDSYYPTWKATIDDREATIYPTDLAFRGLLVPTGNHLIKFFQ